MPAAQLTVESGRSKGRSVLLDEGASVTMGRSVQADIQLPDQGVSRLHCKIENTRGGVVLSDLGSSNGTRVNGAPVNSTLLSPGDTIQMGNIFVRFGLPTTASHPEAPMGTVAEDRKTSVNFVDSNPTGGDMLRKQFRPGASSLEEALLGKAGESPEVQLWKRRLHAIYAMSSAIQIETDLDTILAKAADTVLEVTGADRTAVLLLNEKDEPVPLVTRCRADADDEAEGEFRISSTVVRETLRTGDSVITSDAAMDDRFKGGMSIVMENIHSVMCVPLGTQTRLLGAFYVDSTSDLSVFSEAELSLTAAIGHQTAATLERARLVADLENLFIGSMHAIVDSLEAKDPYTRGHSERVTALAVLLADELGLDAEQRMVIELAGVLHDVGKIGVPEAILCKPGRLTDAEFDAIKQHPSAGGRIIQNMPEIDRIASISGIVDTVAHHHERYDGGGYPDGLAEEAIPLPARILAVADTFDAITSDRPYRKGAPSTKAIAILKECAGSQFDPRLVDAFVDLHERGLTDDLSKVSVRIRLTPEFVQTACVAVGEDDETQERTSGTAFLGDARAAGAAEDEQTPAPGALAMEAAESGEAAG